MRYEPALRFGIWVRRYKRFFVDVCTDAGESMTLHCANTGAMTGCSAPGCRVAFQVSTNPARKLAGTLELVRSGPHWIGVHPARANKLVGEAIDSGVIAPLAAFRVSRAEVRVPGSRSRFDLELDSAGGRCVVEVKSASWVEADGTARFPDAVSTRALRHVEELTVMAARQERVALVFCVQHEGAQRFAPADSVQPQYGRALQQAARAGVELYAYATQIDTQRIALTRRLPVEV